jgi:hypothetical protein
MRKRTLKYIIFLKATSGARAAYRWIMNLRAKIQVVTCAELSKLDRVYEQIDVHLLSRLLADVRIYFLHQWARADVLYSCNIIIEPSDHPLVAPQCHPNMYWHVWFVTLSLATTTTTRLPAAIVAGHYSRRHKTTLAAFWGVWDPLLYDILTVFTRSRGHSRDHSWRLFLG